MTKQIYNTGIYNGPLVDANDEYSKGPFLSPSVRRFLPEHFLEKYPNLYYFIQYYFEYLEQPLNPYWVLGNLQNLVNIENTIEEVLVKLRDQYAPDFVFEDVPEVDKRFLLKNIKSFYAAKGNLQSFKFLFRLLGKEIEITNPIDDVLFVGGNGLIGQDKIIDSFYYTPFTYDIKVDLPYKSWVDFIKSINHPAGMGLFGTYLVELGDQEPILISVPSLYHPNTFDDRSRLDGDITNSQTTIDILDDAVEYFGTDEYPPYFENFTASASTDIITFASARNYYTGERVFVKSTGTLPGGLSAATGYYYIYVSPTTAKLASSLSNAQTNTAINLTTDGTGTHSLASVQDLIIRIDNENIQYDYTDDNSFLNCARGAVSSFAAAHTDISDFTIDTTNDYVIFADRLNIETGKKVTLSTTDTLPDPLEEETDYYCILVEPKTRLNEVLTNSDTSISLLDSSSFPTAGTIKIDGELITYTGNSANTLTGCTRGTGSSAAATHAFGSNVYLWNRVVRLADSAKNLKYGEYINLLDSGTGTHTITGEGVSVSLFTGIIFSRPQAAYTREINAYTSYSDVNRDPIGNIQFKLSYNKTMSSIANDDEVNFGSAHQFDVGNIVYFSSPKSYVDTAVSGTDTTIDILDSSAFPASGTISIGRTAKELLAYSSITVNTLNLAAAVVGDYDSGTPVRIQLPLDDASGLEVERKFKVAAVISSTAIRLVEMDDSSPVLTNETLSSDIVNLDQIGSDASRNWYPAPVESFAANKKGHITQDTTGATGFLREIIDGRHIIVEQEGATAFSSTDFLTVGNGTVSAQTAMNIAGLITSFSDDVTPNDIYGLDIDDLENGGDEFAKEFKFRYPYYRRESAVSALNMFMMIEVNAATVASTRWVVDTTTNISSFSAAANGHVTQGNARGIIRWRDPIRVDKFLIEVDPTSTENFDFVGTSQGYAWCYPGDTDLHKTSGTFTLLAGPYTYAVFQTQQQGLKCMRVISGGGTDTLTLDGNIIVTLGSGGNEYSELVEVFFIKGLSINALEPRGFLEYEYALTHPEALNYIKLTTVEDLSELLNYTEDTATAIGSYSNIAVAHVTQLGTGARGIVRYKPETRTTLNGTINSSATTIVVASTTGFPSSGLIQIEDEQIYYTGKTGTDFTGCTRGAHNTTAAAHTDMADVQTKNNTTDRINELLIEVYPGDEFGSSPAYTITVGNGSSAGNNLITPSTIEVITKSDPLVDDYFMLAGIDLDDPNSAQIYQVESKYDLALDAAEKSALSLSSNQVIGFSEIMSMPDAGLGNIELLLYQEL